MQEAWLNVVGYEGLYEVSCLGNIRNAITKQILKPATCYGYRKATLYDYNLKRHNHRVARLVAQAFIPNVNSLPEINHKDKNRANDAVSNLEWCTHQYNAEYSGKKVEVFSDHKHYGIFDSMTKAGKEFGYSPQLIYERCNSNTPTRHGLYFKYI